MKKTTKVDEPVLSTRRVRKVAAKAPALTENELLTASIKRRRRIRAAKRAGTWVEPVVAKPRAKRTKKSEA
jgi:hypothetical protein